jgi:uncharacterized YigZ family protein
LDEKEALAFIREISARNDTATHNVFAYIDRGGGAVRCSDAGEPKGTAGMPVLEVLKREELFGVVCVVSRWFGGILLGAGGLVRAYAHCAKLAVDEAGVEILYPWRKLAFSVSYALYERILYDLPRMGVEIVHTSFAERIKMAVSVREDKADEFLWYLTEISAGSITAEG